MAPCLQIIFGTPGPCRMGVWERKVVSSFKRHGDGVIHYRKLKEATAPFQVA